MRKSDHPKTLETYYPLHQYKNYKDVPKHKNIDFALYFREFLERDDYKMLEIGCSTGNFLANDPTNILGIDINKNSLKLAKDRGFNVLCGDVEHGLFFKDNSFDAIYASHVIEHLNNQIYFLKECYRILKPDGLLIVITEDFSKAYKVFYDDPTHRHPLTRRSLEKCALEARFKKFKVERQNVPTIMSLFVRKGLLSLNKALLLSKILYNIGIYKHRYGTHVLTARKKKVKSENEHLHNIFSFSK